MIFIFYKQSNFASGFSPVFINLHSLQTEEINAGSFFLIYLIKHIHS